MDARMFKLLESARRSGERMRDYEAARAEAARKIFVDVEERCITQSMRRVLFSLKEIGFKSPKAQHQASTNAIRYVSRGKVITKEQLDAALAAQRLEALDYKRLRRREWFRERAARDPIFKLNRNTRHAVNMSLNGTKRGRKWQTLVGYTIDDLKAHLEAQFTDGMTWENIGQWHVDHIRPLSSFTIAGPDCPEFKAAWALSNLQPLWKPDNLKKGAKWEP